MIATVTGLTGILDTEPGSWLWLWCHNATYSQSCIHHESSKRIQMKVRAFEAKNYSGTGATWQFPPPKY